MGRFLNQGNRKFAEFSQSKYFVDKTVLINKLLQKDADGKFICHSGYAGRVFQQRDGFGQII